MHQLYETWKSMMRRCYNSKHVRYHRYGGRGIKVVERWHDAKTFIADVLKEIGERPDGHTLDRIDNNAGYQPGNIRWATAREQAKVHGRAITIDGETKHISDWARWSGVPRTTINKRLARGIRGKALIS